MSDDPNAEPIPLDRDRCEALFGRVMTAVRDHLALGVEQPSRAYVLEVLNALGCAAAQVVAGVAPAGGVDECMEFFGQTVTAQLNETLVRRGFVDASDWEAATVEIGPTVGRTH